MLEAVICIGYLCLDVICKQVSYVLRYGKVATKTTQLDYRNTQSSSRYMLRMRDYWKTFSSYQDDMRRITLCDEHASNL